VIGENKRRALVLLSGGQDSVTCLYWAVREYGLGNVMAIGFDYGQRHIAELDCACEICAALGVTYEIIALPALNALTENALTRGGIVVEKAEEKAGEAGVGNSRPPNTLVEGRNLLFLTYAAIYAKVRGATVLVTGVGEADFSGYPDCRDNFIKSAQVTISLGLDYPLTIETPLMWRDKKAVWQLADELGIVNIIRERTLTCYNGVIGEGCGGCPACALRRRGWDGFSVK
jgi:7-cyano-7-deazaguanine synthase